MAAEGIRFTSAYAGSTVCAPSRCALMTGLHTGHCRVRGNALVPLAPEDVTVAEVLRDAGYATGLVGKWGLGEPDTSGLPGRQGFDEFFGYLNQRHAHNYYPDYLWRGEQRVSLEGNVVRDNVALERAVYSHDLFTDEALAFVERHAQGPFFLYLAYTIPHANNEAGAAGMEVPSDEPYSDRPWPQAQKNRAAMITRLDRDVGRLLARLDALGIAGDTVVFFSSDNGPHQEAGADPRFFASGGPLRGIKRDLYEGGIRVPLVVRWPGRIGPGESDLPCAFWDFLPTAAELAGAAPPQGTDGASLVPTLLGEGPAGHLQQPREYLYWEFFERGFEQAIRAGRWKGVRHALRGPLELYDLAADVGETRDVAADHPDVVARLEGLLSAARTDSADWPVRAP
jgi:arylsulfatase A-like enzyme